MRPQLRTTIPAVVAALLAGIVVLVIVVPGHRRAALPPRITYTHLIWHDEFTGPLRSRLNPHRWRAVAGNWSAGDGELEYYSSGSANVALDGAGHLAITARRQDITADGKTYRYTSGRIETRGLFQTQYGLLEARIRIPPGRGMWPAFWALGSDLGSVGWPRSGEIDAMETYGDPHTALGTIHGPQRDAAAGYNVQSEKRTASSLADGFHVYGVIWSPDSIEFTLDARPYGAVTRKALEPGQRWVFAKPFYLLLDLAVGGLAGTPAASTPIPATMLVDWVRVYH
jgi:beta-glucanase (GH16 family)